ncbi:MAG: T9SS type A sorting domain-containing protein [Aequorivita sp.]|nr:T9SS type A sorting domain-containing protein [Aequorivita sp.]
MIHKIDRPIVVFLTTFLISLNVNAQIDFENHLIIDDTHSTIGAFSIYAADINGDGYKDILSASFDDNKIAWYENLEGLGIFGAQNIMSINELGAIAVYGADIDNDGDIDVISASSEGNTVSWFENLDGLGNFGPKINIGNNLNGLTSIYISDINGDGKIDILSASRYDNKIAWYENNGNGSFSTQKLIATNAYGAMSVYADDLDGDGDIDVVSANSWDDKIVWYKNLNGQGNFGSSQVISSNANYASGVFIIDIDGDGDNDVLSASRDDNKIAWYENVNNSESFGPQQIITSAANDATMVSAGDIDNDGDMDVICQFQNDKLAWFENTNGVGDFSSQHVISSFVSALKSVSVVDINNDGQLDVITASKDDSKIAWYKNIDGQGAFGKQNIIPRYVINPRGLNTSDIDGDGHLDLLSVDSSGDLTVGTKLSWYKNIDGTGNFGEQEAIIADPYLLSITSGDINGDGHIDIVASKSYPDGIVWYENLDGFGNFSFEKSISSNVDFAISLQVDDIDNDGDLDILCGSYGDGVISFLENLDGLGNFGSHQIISSNTEWVKRLRLADLNGDGFNDVVADYNNHIVWFENLNGTFGQENIISANNVYGQNSLVINDIDGDGYLDIFSCQISYPDAKMVWFKNLDGQGNFSNGRIVSTNNLLRYASLSDIDGDDDLDILTFSEFDDEIICFINDGAGNFGSQQVLWSFPKPKDLHSLDIDGDGDMDIFLTSGDDKINWLENIGDLGLEENSFENVIIYPNPTSDWLTIKSDTKISKIEIYNSLLQLVLTNSNEPKINLSNLNQGLYFCKLVDINQNTTLFKVIKK